MNKCKSCGKNCEKEWCFKCKPRKALPKYSGALKGYLYPGNDNYNNENDKILMHNFFIGIWNKRKHVSEISGEKLGKEPLSTYFHHCAPKYKWPEGKYDEKNIILLTPDEHERVENDMYAYKKITEIRERMIEKYKKERELN